MKIQSANGIELQPIKPPIAIGLEYQRKLVKLVKELNKAVYKAIRNTYGDFESEIAMDASPVFQLQMSLKKVFARYSAVFNNHAQSYAESFINSINKYDYQYMRKELAKQSITIRPDANYVGTVNTLSALISENVELIKDLSDKQYKQIHGDIMRSVANGGDLQYIEKQLRHRGIETEKRARFIARDQLFKSTGAINDLRMSNQGMLAIWKHSKGDKQPRQSHLAANGRIYDPKKGCLIEGEYIHPGQKIKCTCYSAPYIKLGDD